MKRIISLLVFLLSIVSCTQSSKENSKENKAKNDLENAILKAEKSEIFESKAFLGFEFGMTKEELNHYIEKLLKENEIYLNNNKFQYDFNSNGLEIYLSFIPEYYEGKLYKMIYPATTRIGSNGVHVILMSAFKDTRDSFETFINKDVLGETYYTNIKDNLIVTFKDSKMIYENAPISKLVKQMKENERIKKSQKSNSKF